MEGRLATGMSAACSDVLAGNLEEKTSQISNVLQACYKSTVRREKKGGLATPTPANSASSEKGRSTSEKDSLTLRHVSPAPSVPYLEASLGDNDRYKPHLCSAPR